MKIKLLFIAPLFIIQCSMAQWSTSTYADSALYVCPGFNQGILTFDDGSSIICGALNDYRFVQKLDPYGYKIWPQPVQVYYTPGTNNDGNAMSIISDGEGGIILWWADFRGAEYTQDPELSFATNNAVYMQRVDKDGQIKWQPGGVQVDSVSGGTKGGYGVTDGQGGIIFYMEEDDYYRTNATNTSHTWIVRYNSNGEKVWQYAIDSATVRNQISTSQPVRLGNKIMIGTLNGFRFYYTDGNTAPVPRFIPGSMLLFKDSIAFRIELKPTVTDSAGNIVYTYGATRISTSWDSLWYTEYKIIDETNTYGFYSVGNPYITDNQDGFYDVWRLEDKSGNVTTRAQWITKSGSKWGNGDFVISKKSVSALFNGTNKLGLFFSDGTAELFDSIGKALWDTNNVVISDPVNATGPVFASDNNGGCIITYWTTLGGIYAQHTGRTGKVGVITKVPTKENIPLEFELSQNFPNPFNPTTTIRFSINHNARVTLKIFDILGREVATLINNNLLQGKYEVVWSGEGNASGVYFYTLSSSSNTITKKMLLLR
jgi:hypothetical protein